MALPLPNDHTTNITGESSWHEDMVESQRLMMLHDGRCIGCFTSVPKEGRHDAHHHDELLSPDDPPSSSPMTTTAILLEENGACFSHIGKEGKVDRHLTRFPLRHLVKYVTTMVHFRNRHRPRPYMCARFYPKKVPSQVTSTISSLSGLTESCHHEVISTSFALHGNVILGFHGQCQLA